MFKLLIPGIESICSENNCQFIWNGFVPAIRYNENILNLDTIKIEVMASENQYDKISKFIVDQCKGVKCLKN